MRAQADVILYSPGAQHGGGELFNSAAAVQQTPPLRLCFAHVLAAGIAVLQPPSELQQWFVVA